MAVMTLGPGTGLARAQNVGDPVADADLIIDGPPKAYLELFVVPSAVATASALGGVTLFASGSPGGPVLARVTKAPPPPGSGGGWPDFEFIGIPPGTYYIVLIYGIVGAPSVPPSAWHRLDFGTACSGPPGQSLLTPTVSGTTVTFALGASSSGNGCPPDYQQIEVGTAPGLTDIVSFRSPSALFTAVGVPPGDYYLRAYGVNAFGRGPNSLEEPVRVPATGCVTPPIPQNIVASTSPGFLSLSWTLPPTTGPAVVFHEVWVALTQPGGGLQFQGSPVRLPAATAISAPVPAGSYTIFLRSASPCGKSTYSSGAAFVVP